MPMIITDPTTTTALVNAFSVALSDQRSANLAVETASGALPWQGLAAQTYRNGIAQWAAGLAKVGEALQMLQGTMQDFAGQTTNTEADNQNLASAMNIGGGGGGWAKG